MSDHLSLFLVPAYTPLRRKSKPVIKNVQIWPDGALSQLQDCFEHTEWSIFDHLDLQEYTETVLFYMKSCTESVTVEKRIRIYPNQKPWMTSDVRKLLRTRNHAFKSGDKEQYSVARAELQRGIKAAKKAHKRKVEEQLANNTTRQVWQGLESITNYKGSTPVITNADASLAEELNIFFSRFESETPHIAARPPQTCSYDTLTLQKHQVRQVLKTVNTRKAACPDGVLGKVLSACADQLVGVLTRLFNLSL